MKSKDIIKLRELIFEYGVSVILWQIATILEDLDEQRRKDD